MDKLTRDDLVAKVGELEVCYLDKIHCVDTGRINEMGLEEYYAYDETDEYIIGVYYYQAHEDILNCDSLGDLNWVADFYTFEPK